MEIKGAHWDLEMSSIFEIIQREGKEPKPGLVLFDDIQNYPKGYKTLFGLLGSTWGIAKLLGLPENQLDRMSLLRNWRKKAKGLQLIPPKFVKTGPVEENLDTGGKVDVFKFPSPRFHEHDRSRYIGTACCVVQREPDEGWVNIGTYRVMLVDRNRITLHATESQHGGIITYEKYFARGKTMPVAVVMGADPALYWTSAFKIPWGVSEYDYTGGIKAEPIEVIEGPYTGLPLPAHAEIAIEGECHPEDLIDEGPFGEWHGYYGNLGLLSVPEPVIQVKAVHYRNDPILTCAQETVPPHDDCLGAAVSYSAEMWNRLEEFGVPGIQGVWCHELGHANLFAVVSIKQMFAGHSRRAGLIASQSPILARYVVVVEEDIDPTNLEQVIWAMVTRGRPHEKIQIIHNCRSGNHDPAIPPEEKKKYKHPKPLYTSVAIIDACRGFEWREDWYPIAKVSPELRASILEKWKPILSNIL
jgi:4-hydroxy-3-polyprenylbenzoate decarboxylase